MFSFSFKEFPRRSLFARLSRIDYLSVNPHRRASFEFDCIDAKDVEKIGSGLPKAFEADDRSPFALLRIVTTPPRFAEIAGANPQLGDWLRLEIEPGRGGPPTWHSQLGESGYTDLSRGQLRDANWLEGRRGPPKQPHSLGAAVAPHSNLPSPLRAVCFALPTSDCNAAIAVVLRKIPPAHAVTVWDVGQASFSTLVDDKQRSLLHFDTGFPLSFNHRTFPPAPPAVEHSKTPPVILSHWDWDHLHGAWSMPELLRSTWIVPDQPLGPGAARLAYAIQARGQLLVRRHGAKSRFKFGRLGQGQGSPSSLNDSGITLRADLSNGHSVLLTGDADYQYLPSQMKRADNLVATHHGARFAGAAAIVPSPKNANGKLYISYGTRNVYRHPNDGSLRKHTHAGWPPHISTAGRHGFGPRGDRVIQ